MTVDKPKQTLGALTPEERALSWVDIENSAKVGNIFSTAIFFTSNIFASISVGDAHYLLFSLLTSGGPMLFSNLSIQEVIEGLSKKPDQDRDRISRLAYLVQLGICNASLAVFTGAEAISTAPDPRLFVAFGISAAGNCLCAYAHRKLTEALMLEEIERKNNKSPAPAEP